MGFATSLFGGERRVHPSNLAQWLLYGLPAGEQSYTGKTVTEDGSLSSTAVFAAVRLVSETIASLPLFLYRRISGGKKKAEAHNQFKLLHLQPNPEMTAMNFREVLASHCMLFGNFYAEKEVDQGDRLIGLWPLIPDQMTLKREKGQLYYVYNLPDGSPKIFTRDRILHIPGFSPNGLQGYNVIKKGKQAIGLNLALEEYSARFFGNGARPSAVLEHPATLGEKAQKNLRDSWNDVHQGLSNAHRLAILEEGMKLHEYGVDPEKSQLLESRKFSVVEVARLLNVPVHMIKDLDRSTYDNIEQQSLEFVIYSVRPWLVRIEQNLTIQLLKDKERISLFYEHVIDGLLRGDTETRTNAYMKFFQMGVYSPNEIRELENKNPYEGGDDRYIQLNMVTVENAGEPPMKMPAFPPKSEPGKPIDEKKNIEIDEHRGLNQLSKRVQAIQRSFYPTFRVIFERIFTKETKDIQSKAKKLLQRDAVTFGEYLDEYYKKLPVFIRTNLFPVQSAYMEAVIKEVGDFMGTPIDPELGLNPKFQVFMEDYMETYLYRHISSSDGQIRAIMAENIRDVDEMFMKINNLMDDWRKNRTQWTLDDEVQRQANASMREKYKDDGVTKLVWKTTSGKACAFCARLNNKVVGIEHHFVAGMEEIQPEGGEEGLKPMLNYQPKFHPPLHRGCQCEIWPVMA